MNKLILAVISIFLCSAAYAGPKKSLADLDKELKQAKSTETIMGLLGQLEQAVPETEADLAILGQMLDQYPDFARKAALNINNPKLVKSVTKEAKKQIDSLQLTKEKDWGKLPKEERQKRFNALMNTYALFGTLGKLKHKEAVPFLKQYITPEYDGVLSYNASQALGFIGDETVLDEMVRDIGKTKEIDLSAFGDKAFVKILKELKQPGLKSERKYALINQIKGSRSPERKKALKELVLHHEDEDVRNRSGQALINTLILNPEEGDGDFLYEWLPGATKDLNAGWALTAIRIHFPDKNRPLEKRFVPMLFDILLNSQYDSSRGKAAELLGVSRVMESLSNLENCVWEDRASSVRGQCRYSIWQITGDVPRAFHPDDIKEFSARDWREEARFYANMRRNDPIRLYSESLMEAFLQYSRAK